MYARFLINMLIFGRSAPFYFKLLRETDKNVLKYIPHFCFTSDSRLKNVKNILTNFDKTKL